MLRNALLISQLKCVLIKRSRANKMCCSRSCEWARASLKSSYTQVGIPENRPKEQLSETLYAHKEKISPSTNLRYTVNLVPDNIS